MLTERPSAIVKIHGDLSLELGGWLLESGVLAFLAIHLWLYRKAVRRVAN
jgi:hypothetical protein